ncbi:3-deoxy-manno-octulosonate cytidylyltransferase [Denitrificimonas sp. JX-1]|uniref:3-deoxy-manno-octulosonate cytidylyltransferase n=1 Tax=Denitrificimonas halotolerans TaxID=3098930 RepID=A0ABU5GM81_9GAMM|nr:3-deoxy-manno-octulosonate cytidylyltransferase [Denitrificimonas sp. JX-1]MDY7217998.1 3-deoxy-manno-octulosonate cytidylyltransferase [Denitrificimonas sp. JX-1]
MTQEFYVIIPARFASTRFPGKPLQDIAGMPMIKRVWLQAQQSAARQVIIATDDQRIFDLCQSIGAKVVMTRDDHESGTDRLAEVVAQLKLPADAIVVNVQGDEPLIPPAVIDQVAANLAHYTQASMATLAEPITDIASVLNPNVVKVSTDMHGYALTFSRAPLPWPRDAFAKNQNVMPEGVHFRRHIGIYAYRAGFLADFVAWGACALELTESLEQLRALWNGARIHVADAVEAPPAGVDTLEDLQRVRRFFEES